jgi:hypothetical protein
LILGIVVIGVVPFVLKDLINPGTEMMMQKIADVVK